MPEYRTEPLPLSTRMALTIEMLNPNREWGRVSELSALYNVSRTWLYQLRDCGQAALAGVLSPSSPGPQPARQVIEVDELFIRRAIMVMPMLRGSVRDIQLGLDLLLNVQRSVGYIQGTLADVGRETAAYNRTMVPTKPVLGEADEIFCGDQPCLTVVDGASFALLNISAAEARDETTWGLKFLELCEQGVTFEDLVSDGALGIQAGAEAAGLTAPHYRDLFHQMHDGTKITQRLEREMTQAMTDRDVAWQVLDEATAPVRRPGRPRQSTVSLEDADHAVLVAMETHDNWTWLLQTVRQALQPLTPTGQMADATAAQQTIQAATQLMLEMNRDDISHFATQLHKNLPSLLAPLRRLAEALTEIRHDLTPEYEAFITHLWTFRHDHQLPIEQLFPPALQPVAHAFWHALDRFHRASSLAESFHAWLRPFLEIHRSLPAWLAALLKLFWNHRVFSRGKRQGHAPLALATDGYIPSLPEAIDAILQSSQVATS